MKKYLLSSFLLLCSCSSYPLQMVQTTALGSARLEAQRSAKKLDIRLFRSYGNESQVWLKARVIQAENQKPESPHDSSLVNFWRNLTSLSVKEVPGIQVIFSLNGKQITLVSDKEGMIQAPVGAFGPLSAGLYTLQAELAPGQKASAPLSTEKIVIQSLNSQDIGIVSDIDDTIKLSNVTQKLSALRRLLFSNSYSSEPIPGTAMLYQRLENRDGLADGDITYISGSPFNLSPSIYRFMDFRTFPSGAIELKKWGFGKTDDSPMEQYAFKLSRLRQLFTTYPQKSFLFFGDSGEKDPEIYRQIAQEFPGRVKGIFINNVTQASSQDPRFQGTYLTRDAVEAAQILLNQGLLTPADLEAIQAAQAGKIFAKDLPPRTNP